MEKVMRCKLQLHGKLSHGENLGGHVRFGGVWEGSCEAQAASENAVFGNMTPMADFSATIRNQAVFDKLEPGKRYYVDFVVAE